MPARIPLDQDQIAAFCRRWQITEFALFGSVLRDDFGPESDVDVLVTFAPDTQHDITDLLDMKDELQQMLGRKVDLVQRRNVEANENYIIRKHILRSLEPVHLE
jgi:predicted nucleotidyltransferase